MGDCHADCFVRVFPVPLDGAIIFGDLIGKLDMLNHRNES
jgi:hypothetical protein